MQPEPNKKSIASLLQAKINAMQGLGKLSQQAINPGFAPFNAAFPESTFPVGALHEFVSYEPAHAASTTGFMTALVGKIMHNGGLCLWISTERKIFPVGLTHFGIAPDRIIFITIPKQKDKLWVIEEALKCEALSVVIGEMKELSFTESRRLQLAIERSGVTGFIHRHALRFENSVACTARWKITPLPSTNKDDLPGVGYSCWNVQLLKVKNGRPDAWKITWMANRFTPSGEQSVSIPSLERYAG